MIKLVGYLLLAIILGVGSFFASRAMFERIITGMKSRVTTIAFTHKDDKGVKKTVEFPMAELPKESK
jgi:hypothetical protein